MIGWEQILLDKHWPHFNYCSSIGMEEPTVTTKTPGKRACVTCKDFNYVPCKYSSETWAIVFGITSRHDEIITVVSIIIIIIIIPWSRVLENLTDLKLVEKFPYLIEHKGSLPYSQQPATCPYSEPVQFSPSTPSHFLKIHFNFIFASTPDSSKQSSSLRSPL
jgi:hypothetical protein